MDFIFFETAGDFFYIVITRNKHLEEKMIRRFLLLTVVLVVGISLLTVELPAKVVEVKAGVSPATFKGKCPHTFTFTGFIKSDSAGIVKFQWKRSDGAIAPIKTLRFPKPGVKKVTTTWRLSAEGKRWQALAILAPNKMVSNRAFFTLDCLKSVKVKPMRPVRPVKPVRQRVRPVKPVKPGVLKPRPVGGCMDPAANEIRFSIVRRISQFKARVRITGVIKNIGSKAFQSGPNQAKAYLYQVPLGGTPRTVAQREIRTLAPGASFNLVYERDWNSSSPSEGEFPPNFKLSILLDPDIYMDANENNDDCNQGNNNKERSGTEINTMVSH